ncbi:MAG: DUF177 domain-containing protein [Magnetovibrio sp.]|nr:DUF177 domain-containing protein [Magnetovibrio sp.]
MDTNQLEFSRPVVVEKLGHQKFTQHIEPRDHELEALTQRLKIESLNSLKADVSVKLLSSGDVVVDASFEAQVTQSCGVTLEPVVSDIKSVFTTTYSPSVEECFGAPDEGDVDYGDDFDPPDPIENGIIDIGEAVVEHLALEIDPFPRVKGATFDGYSAGAGGLEEPAPEKKNPFAVLSKLKDTSESSDKG